ncbi:MAG: 23S rRNA (pseudouridine(1915)-N(3))-methyltransferase RlmH [Campylobacter sp.]|nr:23S rRNA (pseudouridine(1915)-N(3))-methyltransferase RlmH [Campylobacter sp.]
MVQIFVHSIQKTAEFKDEINEYIKMSSKFAVIKDEIYFNSSVAKAQMISREQALKAYDEIYENKAKGYCIALDERGVMCDSFEFANLLKSNSQISFFIGGAYGLSENFKAKMDKVVSLTRLTLAHKVAKLVLFEQIFRALCINASHPYHK